MNIRIIMSIRNTVECVYSFNSEFNALFDALMLMLMLIVM